MPHNLALLPYWCMRLTILIGARPKLSGVVTPLSCLDVKVMRVQLTALLYHELSKFKVAAFTRRLAKPHESQFDFWMAIVAPVLARLRAKSAINVVSVSTKAVQKLSVSRSLLVGNSRLYQMPCTVQFVPVTQIFPAHLRLGNRKMGIEITICLLCTNDFVGYFVDYASKNWIGICDERIASSLQPLSWIRVTENQHN